MEIERDGERWRDIDTYDKDNDEHGIQASRRNRECHTRARGWRMYVDCDSSLLLLFRLLLLLVAVVVVVVLLLLSSSFSFSSFLPSLTLPFTKTPATSSACAELTAAPHPTATRASHPPSLCAMCTRQDAHCRCPRAGCC